MPASQISSFNIDSWQPSIDDELEHTLLNGLEQGQVVYLPKLAYQIAPERQYLLDEQYLADSSKNISYDPSTGGLRGANRQAPHTRQLTELLSNFCQRAHTLVKQLFPHYSESLRLGRTSFRPAEIAGREAPSYRKDDTRLHVDAFPSLPMRGERILRIFSNVNPKQKPRVWHLGQRFDEVMRHFVPMVHPPMIGAHSLLNYLGITKSKRSAYDHYMLTMHHEMKRDNNYQITAIQERFEFPANTTWIVFTDMASHAALSGQHLLEQTFYLPVDAQFSPKFAPLKQLEEYLDRALI